MPKEKYTPEKIRGMYGRSEIDIKFPTPIPVNITYQTAFVDDAGKLQIRKDIYGRDAEMIGAAMNSRSKDLENVVAHSQPSYARPERTRAAGQRQRCQRRQFWSVILRAPVRRPAVPPRCGPRSAGSSNGGG